MNKFIKSLFWENTDRYKAVSPIMDLFKINEIADFQPPRYKTLYQLKLSFTSECWVEDNVEKNTEILMNLKNMVAKRLHYEIFGEISSLFGELRYHFINEDYTRCEETLRLIDAALSI